MANSKDLSRIQSLQDLQKEITRLKATIIVHESQLKTRFKNAPAEVKKLAVQKMVPVALGRIIPFILTRGAVAKSWGLLRNATGLISVFRRQKKGGVKAKIINTAKNVGVSAAIKGIVNFIKNRKRSHEKIEVL